MAADADGDAAPRVEIETNMGTFTVELYYKHAPRTCSNFAGLASRGYYDGVPFHRIVAGFVIQGGDPTGSGRGGDSIYGGPFEDEIHPDLGHRGAGILSMVPNAGKNTNRSQFFVTLAPTPHLDGKHTVFGRVASGMAVVEKIGAVPSDSESGRPTREVKMVRVRVVSGMDKVRV